MMKDYYEALGISKTASSQEIHDAYRRRVLLHHPDRNPEEVDASRFREIQEAYEVVGDPARRQEYDQNRSTAGSPTNTGETQVRRAAPAERARRSGYARPPVWPKDAGDWSAWESPARSAQKADWLRDEYAQADPFTELERIAARLRIFLFNNDWL